MITESKFQTRLIQRIVKLFPLCIILKNDPNYIQGIPDLLILNGNKWAALEIKKNKNATRRPNQRYYVEVMDHMSYATTVYPENMEEVLDELQQTL